MIKYDNQFIWFLFSIFAFTLVCKFRLFFEKFDGHMNYQEHMSMPIILRRMQDSDKLCWICLANEDDVTHSCACPRWSHPMCLATWQKQKQGTAEEHQCRFCNHTLPPWRDVFEAPMPSAPPMPTPKTFLILFKRYKDDEQYLRVQYTPSGISDFKMQVTNMIKKSNMILSWVVVPRNNEPLHFDTTVQCIADAFECLNTLDVDRAICAADLIYFR